MDMCLLVLLSLSVCCAYAENSIPFLMWGSTTSNYDEYRAPKNIKEDILRNVLQKEYDSGRTIVIFIEEELSPEILRYKLKAQPVFKFLSENVQDKPYFLVPGVQSALDKLMIQYDGEKSNVTTFDIKNVNSRLVLMKLFENDEDSQGLEYYKNHDRIMSKVYNGLKMEGKDVVGVYTAEQPEFVKSRVKRQSKEELGVSLVSQNLLMDVASLVYKEGNDNIVLSQKPTESTEVNNTAMSVLLTFGSNKINLNFASSGGYWIFESVNFTKADGVIKNMLPISEVYAPHNFSYRCQMNVIFEEHGANVTDKSNLTFTNLNIQPFFEPTNSSNPTYGDSFDCVGFFSVPIWSGLLVSFFLLIITFCGIIMMMDIRTMDRFDDPKGKTITINAAE